MRHVRISGMGTNPIRELRSVLDLWSLFRQESVDLVFSYTPKGNLYAALACMADALVPGLGQNGNTCRYEMRGSVASARVIRKSSSVSPG